MFQSLSEVMNMYVTGMYKTLKFKKHTDLASFVEYLKNKHYREGIVNIKYVFHSLYNWCLKYFPP